MVSIVLVSHGTFAEGIEMSAQMIFGPQENVAAVTLMPEMGPDDLKAKLLGTVSKLEDQEQVLFLVDLQGGTPWNQVSLLLAEEGHESWVAVGGMNLPMLISAYAARMGVETAADVAQEILPEAISSICVQPEELAPAEPTPAEPTGVPASSASTPVGAIPPGTVLGDGHIKIALCRVDTRLLHGQVAMAWTKSVAPDRIIVVSDSVSHDELRKTMIVQAAPPGVKVNVVPVSKIIEVSKDPRFGATKVMLLFETPQDVLRAIEGGVDIKRVNLGSMAHSVGKVVVTQTVAMDAADVECLEAIAAKGIEFDVRKVPGDSPENFEAIIRKAKAELSAQASQV